MKKNQKRCCHSDIGNGGPSRIIEYPDNKVICELCATDFVLQSHDSNKKLYIRLLDHHNTAISPYSMNQMTYDRNRLGLSLLELQKLNRTVFYK